MENLSVMTHGTIMMQEWCVGESLRYHHPCNDGLHTLSRMLGYSGGTHSKSSYFGTVSNDFSMDDVACSGSESSIYQCSYSSIDDCSGSEGAGVRCY